MFPLLICPDCSWILAPFFVYFRLFVHVLSKSFEHRFSIDVSYFFMDCERTFKPLNQRWTLPSHLLKGTWSFGAFFRSDKFLMYFYRFLQHFYSLKKCWWYFVVLRNILKRFQEAAKIFQDVQENAPNKILKHFFKWIS